MLIPVSLYPLKQGESNVFFFFDASCEKGGVSSLPLLGFVPYSDSDDSLKQMYLDFADLKLWAHSLIL